MTTLLLSQGVPMILGGDEICRTQKGNNNAYCQDSKISYFNWKVSQVQLTFFEFVKKIIKIRKTYTVFKREKFFTGKINPYTNEKDISWINKNGKEFSHEDWQNPKQLTIGIMLNPDPNENGAAESEKLKNSTLFIMMNRHPKAIKFKIPKNKLTNQWRLILDTSLEPNPVKRITFLSGRKFHLSGFSVAVLEAE
jgi:glycogen operon protein